MKTLVPMALALMSLPGCYAPSKASPLELGRMGAAPTEYQALLAEIQALRSDVRAISLESEQDKAQAAEYTACDNARFAEYTARSEKLSVYFERMGLTWSKASEDPRTKHLIDELDDWNVKEDEKCERIRPYNLISNNC